MGKWSKKYDKCRECGTTERPHLAKGSGTKLCECGCGTVISKVRINGEPKRFAKGHNFKKEGKIEKICPVCGKKFKVYPSNSSNMTCCSWECSIENRKLKNKKIDSKGYVVRPGYCSGSNREHRLVMEEKLGRKLKTNEYIHHIDGDKTNNDPDNLKIMTPAEHIKYHLKKSGYRE